MKINNYNISWPTVVINFTYWLGLIFVGIGMTNPLLIIGIGSLVYSGIYGFKKMLE